MLLVRIGRKGRWLGSDSSADTAVKDLSLRPGEAGLSVYKVDSLNEAVAIAKIHAPTARKKVDKIDFLLFEEGIIAEVEGLDLRQTDCNLHPALSSVHHEICGLSLGKARLLAEAILGGSFDVKRISETDLVESVRSRIKVDEKFKDYIHQDWRLRATTERLS
jgi:hypothetical protein